MGTAVVAITDQFRREDFKGSRKRPVSLYRSFAGFYGSLEEVNADLRRAKAFRLRATPAHLL